MSIESFSLEDLRRLLNVPRNLRGNSFKALCPSHDDQTPSLSVTRKGNKILLYCHAGCNLNDICDRLGIIPAQLFDSPLEIERNGKKQVEATYDYLNETGDCVYQVVRYTGKRFGCRRHGDNGDWKYRLDGAEQILYRMPEIAQARDRLPQTIFLCEGEKDVETLERHGFLATCNPFGAGKWRDAYADELCGFDCIILPDNDDAGREHSLSVAQSLHGKAASVKIVDLPGLTEKADVTDWFDAGHSTIELNELVTRTAVWLPKTLTHKIFSPGLLLTSVQDLLAEPDVKMGYVWDDTLPVGGLSVLSGKPKLGKSTIARNLAICIAQGKPFLGRGTKKGIVIYLCLEEIRAQVRLAFKKAGVSDESILICTEIVPLQFLEDLKLAVAKYGPILLIIDPMSRAIRERDFNDYPKMAQALEPFIDLARKSQVHIMLVHHDNKSRGGSDGVLGSTAIFGAVDTHIQIAMSDNWKRTVKSTNRYGYDLVDTVITQDKETGLLRAEGTLLSINTARYEEKVMALMHKGESLTELEIKGRVGTSSLVSKAIRSLCLKEFLFKTGAGKKGNPQRYQKIKEMPIDPTRQF